MNINLFFITIIAGLSGIFFLFKPLDIKQKTFGEIPMLELEKFKLTELTTEGLSSILNGEIGTKYTDRYIMSNLDYIDNAGNKISNLKSDKGLYKGEVLDLNDNVRYTREDGLTFITQKAIYNKKTNIVISSTDYVSTFNENKVIGTYLEYNTATTIAKSKNITANYKLKER